VLEADPDIPEEISAIYRELKNAEQNGAQPHSEVLSNVEANVRSEMASFSMKALMEDCQSRLDERDELIENYQEQLGKIEELLGDTQKQLDEAKSQLAEIRGSISWKSTAFIRKGFGFLGRLVR
jgi:chromosome condensin MukBEF ATPase and DNA-binding subunit MukB